MKALSLNMQRIESQFEFQMVSRLYEENIITTLYQAKNDVSTISKGIKTSSSEMNKGIK